MNILDNPVRNFTDLNFCQVTGVAWAVDGRYLFTCSEVLNFTCMYVMVICKMKANSGAFYLLT